MTKSSELLQRFEADSSRWQFLSNDERHIMDGELDEMLKSIASCDTAESAEPLLQELGCLQEAMATLAFKHGVELSHRQREIVREYDRFDVQDVRRHVFQKIKNAEFPWCVE
ncbi:MAG: hypothetical protein IT427_19445 [Pirellulales bacterium]|nr:hypothetical protein [Pirellulales bacterium]